MADQLHSRMEKLEWLLDVAIDRVISQPGPRDQFYVVLKARPSQAEADLAMDTITSLQARVETNNPPTKDEILNALGNIRPTGIGSGPVHFVGVLLEAFEAKKLLLIWEPAAAASTP